MRRRAGTIPFLLPLAIGLLVRCGPSGPGSPTESPGPPDPADAPRLGSVTPGAAEVRVESGDQVEFRVEATSPRSLPLSITFLVDGVPRVSTPSFVFEADSPGRYRVVARVTDGELVTTREWIVEVQPPPPVNQSPTAVLGIEPGSGTAPLAARFRVQGGDPDGTVVRWRLELVGPDPVIVEGTAPIDTVLVLGAGSWQATAVVEDDGGATAVATLPVTVSPPNQPPVATLRVDPSEGTAPLEALVEGSGVDPDGSVVSYRVDLDGDGGFDLESPAPIRQSVRFERPGTRWVRLSVTDNRGAEARDSVAIRVSDPPPPAPPAPPPPPPPAPPPPPPPAPPPPPPNAPPTAGLSVDPAVGDAPLEVTAHATGSDSDGAVVEVRIDFDDDGVPEAAGPGPTLDASFVFAAPGTRIVRATVVDDGGATASATATVAVRSASNQPPTGSLTVGPTSGDAPLEVTVTASGTDPDGRIVQWELDADEGGGFVDLGATRAATLVYGFRETAYRPRLRLTDEVGASTVVAGPAVTVHRPIGGGSGVVTGNPRFDATGIAPGVWSNGTDPWRFDITVVSSAGEPLAGVPLRATPTRAPLSAPDGTSLGPGAIAGPSPLVTDGAGGASGTFVTSLSTRIEEAPAIGFRPFALLIEGDAGHGQWRSVARIEGLNANSTVAAADTRLLVRPANLAVCPGTPIEFEIQAVNRPDAPSPGAPAANQYSVLRYTDGTLVAATPRLGYGAWRTDAAGIIRFSYAPTRTDQSRLVRAWVDGQPIDELVVLALRPESECPG